MVSPYTVWYYTDDILNWAISEDTVHEAPIWLVTHLQHRDWTTVPHKIQGPATTVKSLGINWSSKGWEALLAVKHKFHNYSASLHIAASPTRPSSLHILEATHAHLSIVLRHISAVTHKPSTLYWEKLNSKLSASTFVQPPPHGSPHSSFPGEAPAPWTMCPGTCGLNTAGSSGCPP